MIINRGFVVLFFGLLISGCFGRARDVLLGEKIDSKEELGIKYSFYASDSASQEPAVYLLFHPAGFSSEEYLRKWVSLLGKSGNVLIAPDSDRTSDNKEEFEVRLYQILKSWVNKKGILNQNMILIGESNGAIAGFRMLSRFSDNFRAAVMISSAIDQKAIQAVIENANEISTQILMVHGAEDQMIRIQMIEESYQSLKNVNVPVELRVVPGMGHGSDIFTDEKIVDWINTKTTD